jgi:hypothetical protein
VATALIRGIFIATSLHQDASLSLWRCFHGREKHACERENKTGSLLWLPSDMTAELVKEFEPARGVMPVALASTQRISAAEEMAETILYLASKPRWY